MTKVTDFPSSNPHMVQMSQSIIADLLAGSMYEERRRWFRLHLKPWAEMNLREREPWLLEAVQWLSDHKPGKCIYCGTNWAVIGSEYCGPTCRIDAERG